MSVVNCHKWLWSNETHTHVRYNTTRSYEVIPPTLLAELRAAVTIPHNINKVMEPKPSSIAFRVGLSYQWPSTL